MPSESSGGSFRLGDRSVSHRHKVSVGLFVASLYDLDFTNQKYAISAWVWAKYDPEGLPDDYEFSDHMEIINARKWIPSSTEHFVIDHPDGSRRTMTKFTAILNQNWDLTHFPFDKQHLRIVIEGVELDSSKTEFVPDVRNSMIGKDFRLSGWRISDFRAKGHDYEYPTTFGDPSGAKGIYPRVVFDILIEREGARIFLTAFLGFFISYVIISTLVFFDRELFSNRISLIVSTLFASVGNKYTIDFFFPPQSSFMLSDLVQVATFAIIAIALINTITVNRIEKSGKEKLALGLDIRVSLMIIFGYPLIIFWGVCSALGMER